METSAILLQKPEDLHDTDNLFQVTAHHIAQATHTKTFGKYQTTTYETTQKLLLTENTLLCCEGSHNTVLVSC
jgi:hypothetical protein